MDLEKQKKNFKNHIATFTDYGNIKILDFENPESSLYRIRFLFEEDWYRCHISGDLGELIACNYCNMTFDKFTDFVNNTGYFEEKIKCHSRQIYWYDEDAARYELEERIKEYGLLDYYDRYSYSWDDDEEEKLKDALDDILSDFSATTGISSDGYEALKELDNEAYEWAYDLGKKGTGILDLYMLAFKLAMEQLKEGANKNNETSI